MAEDAEKAAKEFVRELWSLQGVAYAVVTARYYSKISHFGWKSLSWDDALMGLATLVYTAESVMAHLVVAYWQGLANNAMTDEQRARLDPASEEWRLRVNGSKTHVAGLLLYTTLLWLLKGCWLIYYARLTDGVGQKRRMIHAGTAIMSGTYVSCLLVAFLKCIPFDHQWQINPSPGNRCMPAISFIQTIFVMVMNTATDFYLMAIPLPVIWGSHLPGRKKFVLLLMFSGGFLEMAFGILRCVSILTMGDTDPAQSGYWSVRESFVSFVLTNMPMVYPLFRGLVEKGRSAISSSSRSHNPQAGYEGGASGSRGYRLGSISRGPKRNVHKHPLSMPNDTVWDSKEQFVIERTDPDPTRPRSAASSTGNDEGAPPPLGLPLPVQRPGVAVTNTTNNTRKQQQQHASSQPRSHQDPDHIMVTNEYTVADAFSGAKPAPETLRF